jgi:hypothetical protein
MLKGYNALKRFHDNMKGDLDLKFRYGVLEEDFKIQSKKLKEMEQNYELEISNLRKAYREKIEFTDSQELRNENTRLSKEIFFLSNKLKAEKHKNEKLQREIHQYTSDTTSLIKSELNEVLRIKEDLLKEKAKNEVMRSAYYSSINNDFPKKKMVSQEIDRQESLNRLPEYKLAQIIESNSRQIFDLINDDPSEVSPIEYVKTLPNETSVFGKGSIMGETLANRTHRPADSQTDRKFEKHKADQNKEKLFEY